MRVTEIGDDAGLRGALESIASADVDGAAAQEEAQKLAAVKAVLDDIRTRGDAAVAEYTEKFDRVALTPDRFLVDDAELDAATGRVPRETLEALKRAHDNVTAFHQKNLRQSWEETSDDGSVLGQRITPIESVGLYVPGGTAFYPSSVLMNIVPARVAGVREIVMVSPPSFEGSIHPLVLAAARIAGATRVYRIGGAQAIAALAYGTEHVTPVLKIAGPGNIYVTLAKRLVSSICDIDKEAGPSEVVVIADDDANADQVALELLAQAEHDEDACATLVCLSKRVVEQTAAAIEKHLKTLTREAIIRRSLTANGRAFVVRSLADAATITNAIAPEHLSIQTSDPRAVFDMIANAGCAILGGATSVAVGDYYAGPNHILPTGRRARFSSPLTAEDFRKVTSVISFTPERMTAIADDIIQLALAEKLDAHARAVEIRK